MFWFCSPLPTLEIGATGSSYTGSSALTVDIPAPGLSECSLACSYSVDSLRGGLLTVISSSLLLRCRTTNITTTAMITRTSKTEPTAMPVMAAVLSASEPKMQHWDYIILKFSDRYNRIVTEY